MSTSPRNSRWMGPKVRGLILLAAGIGITGASGAALSTDYRAYLALEGQLNFAEASSEAARKEYCAAREQYGNDNLPGDPVACPDEAAAEAESSAEQDSDDSLSPWEQRAASVNEAAALDGVQPADLLALRSEWIRNWQATVEPLKAVETAQVVDPQTRVQQWFQANGALFGLGFFLVLWGAWMSRKALQEALSSDPEEGNGAESGAVDFGELLDSIVGEARTIQSEMKALAAPHLSDLDALQVRLERLQKEDLTRLLSAGPRLQMKYGITAFASIFSPLAGAERRLNRLWSTLVDRHWPESMVSIDAAVNQLESAQIAWSATLEAA